MTVEKTFEEQINELAAPVKEVVKKEFQTKLNEATEQAKEDARLELNAKYKADLNKLVESADAMIKDHIGAICKDLLESQKAKLDAYKKVNETIKAFEEKINESLNKELETTREDRARLDSHLEKLDEMAKSQLVAHIQKLEEEKTKYIQSTAKVLEEGYKAQEDAKNNFVKAASQQAANVIFKNLDESISSLKSEIKEAQANTFGQRIFEKFAGEFKTIFLNENREIQKINSEKEEIKGTLAKAKKMLEAKNSQIASLKSKIDEQVELRQREAIIAEASKGLSDAKKAVLATMVEGVATNKLESVIAEYIPAVLAQGANSKKFTESSKPVSPKLAVKTGDTKVVNESVVEAPKATPMNKINEEIANIDIDMEYIDRMLGM